MSNHINPLKYPEHNWILVSKDTGKVHAFGEGVKVFRNHTEASEERDRLMTLGYWFIPMPLIAA